MKNRWKLLIVITLILILCISMLTACNNPADPHKEQTPSSPTDATGGDENDPTGSNQDQIPTGPVNGDENDPTGPSQDQTPTNPGDDDSSFMDGDDHVEAPFG